MRENIVLSAQLLGLVLVPPPVPQPTGPFPIVCNLRLFEVSINYAGCHLPSASIRDSMTFRCCLLCNREMNHELGSRDLPTEYWLQLGCDIRFGRAHSLSSCNQRKIKTEAIRRICSSQTRDETSAVVNEMYDTSYLFAT